MRESNSGYEGITLDKDGYWKVRALNPPPRAPGEAPYGRRGGPSKRGRNTRRKRLEDALKWQREQAASGLEEVDARRPRSPKTTERGPGRIVIAGDYERPELDLGDLGTYDYDKAVRTNEKRREKKARVAPEIPEFYAAYVFVLAYPDGGVGLKRGQATRRTLRGRGRAPLTYGISAVLLFVEWHDTLAAAYATEADLHAACVEFGGEHQSFTRAGEEVYVLREPAA